jgi:hypothetical protein
MKTLLLALSIALSAQALAAQTYHNSARIYEKDGHMMGEIYSAEGGLVNINGTTLELKQGKLYLNGQMVYRGKGLIHAELQTDADAPKLTVNGKPVALPAAK